MTWGVSLKIWMMKFHSKQLFFLKLKEILFINLFQGIFLRDYGSHAFEGEFVSRQYICYNVGVMSLLKNYI